MISNMLPPIGRSGIPNTVRRLAGGETPGWRDVDPATDFMAGMVAALKMSGNKVVVTKADAGSSMPVIGLFYCHKTTWFYRPIVNAEVTFDASNKVYLKPYVVASSFVVKNASGTVIPQKNTTTNSDNYTLDAENGVLTRVDTSGVPATVYVSYRYKDPNLAGIDQTMSGKVSVLEGNGEIATLVYDTAAAWTLGAVVTVNADGLLTVGGAGQTVGICTKPPTVDDPELHIKMRL